jgi:hypothetical protein
MTKNVNFILQLQGVQTCFRRCILDYFLVQLKYMLWYH